MTEKQQLKEKNAESKKMGLGIRHVQMACMFICITSLLIVRSCMGVAILAMTDTNNHSGNVTIYEWNKTIQGIILSSFFWGYMLMQLPAGLLSKRFGGKIVLLVTLLINAVLCLAVPLFASVGGWPLVCACRMVTGFAQSFTFPATHTLLGRWLPSHEITLLSGLVYGGTQLGTILGMPLSGFLAGTKMGWPLVFYAMTALMLVTAVLWYWMTAACPSEHRLITDEEREYIEKYLNSQGKKRMQTPWRYILTSKAVWAIVVAHAGTAYGFILFFVDMPTYLEKGLGISLKSSASLSALPYIGMWVGSVLSTTIYTYISNKGLLSTTVSRKIFNSISAFGISVGLLGLIYAANTPTLAMIWLVGALTVNGFYTAGFMVNHLDLSPNLAGLLLSLTNCAAGIVCVVTPLVTSYLLNNNPTDLTRWRIVFLVTAVVSIASNTIYVIFGTSELQPWDDPNFLEKEAHPEEMKPLSGEEKKKEAELS